MGFEVIIGVLSGLASAVVVLGFFLGMINSLKRKIENLENEKFVKLEKKLDDHIDKDQLPAILYEVKKINKMSDKLDRFIEETAEQRAQIAAQGLYIGNLDKALQSHENGGHHHD